MEEVLLDNGTQQAVYEVASLVITAVVTILGIYIRNFINTNKTIAKYNFDNERTERLLTNAILFAENKAKQMAKDGINKRELSVKYLDDISPDVVKQNGDKLASIDKANFIITKYLEFLINNSCCKQKQ